MFLRQAGILEDRKEGWRVYYRITNPQIPALIPVLPSVPDVDLGDALDH